MDLFNFRFNSVEPPSSKEETEYFADIPSQISYSTYLFMEKFGGKDGLLKRLHTKFTPSKIGIVDSEEDRQNRRQLFGKNEYPVQPTPSLIELLSVQLGEKYVKLLIAASLLFLISQYANHEKDDGNNKGVIQCLTMITTIVFISLVFAISIKTLINESSKMRQQFNMQEVSVYRNNNSTVKIQSTELVVGDIIRLVKGMMIPADCILIQAGHPKQQKILAHLETF